MNFQVGLKNEELSFDSLGCHVEKLISEFKINRAVAGDVILCMADSHLGTLIQWISCLESGIIPLFVPLDYTIERVQSFNKSISVKLAVKTTKLDSHSFLEIYPRTDTALMHDIPAGSAIHITSATSGSPKLVLRKKKQLDTEAARYCKHLSLTRNDVILPIVPLYHSFGFTSAMLASLKIGAKLVLPEIILPRNIIELCNAHSATVLLGVPYFFSRMISVSDNYNLKTNIRYVLSSGSPMEDGLQKSFHERFGLHLLQQYGSTETGSLAVSEPWDEYNVVGCPIDGVRFDISADRDEKPWIYVTSPDTIGSYINENGVVDLSSVPYKMGDVGELNEEGKLVIHGRGDDVLLLAGKKISRKNVVDIIKKITEVKEADVFIDETSHFKELSCEYTGESSIPPDTFITCLKEHLPDYQIPKSFVKVQNISRINRMSWKQR